MTDQSFIESVDFNGLKLRYLKGPDLLFVLNDVAAALGYTSRDGLMFRVSKSDIERIQGTSRVMNAIKWSKLCDLLLITSNQKPEQSRSLRDFIVKNILPRVPEATGGKKKLRYKQKPLVDQFGGDIAGWRNGNLVTTSSVIAGAVKFHHCDVMKWVSDCRAKIEQFGRIEFDEEFFVVSPDSRTERIRVAIFNEKQAAILLTCMHKERLKKHLISIFYEKSLKGCPDVLPVRLPVPDIPLVDIPVSTVVDRSNPAIERSFDASRATPELSPAAPVLAVGVVEPFISSDNSLTMSSLEIAELTGKDHKNVMADIRKMLAELGKAAADFSATAFIDGPNNSKRKIKIFNLPKRETLILVSGYSIAMRARIIDRWQDLERQATGVAGQPQFAIPQTLHEALQLASNLEKERSVAVEKLAVSDEKLAVSDAKLAIAEPKAVALDVIANTEGLYGLQEAGKALGQPPNLFIKWLKDEVKGWIYQRSRLSKILPFKEREVDGCLIAKSVARPDYYNGGEKMELQTMVTPKGLTRIALLLKEIPPSYAVDKPISTPKPRGLARQAINRATKPVVPDMFREMQAGQQEPLF